jgi:protocatechuate 3,4-dioxygenase beta subunit
MSLIPFIPLKVFGDDECITSDDIEGPFFEENVPLLNVIAPQIEGVPRLFITGTIYAKDCISPIANALIDVWHANKDGEYESIDYRGKIYSDENGNYNFETIQPGKYLNGLQYRPSHIHFKVSYLNNPILTTQLYFEGDTSIENDQWASTEEAQNRIITLETDQNNNLNGIFDISLDINQNTVNLTDFNRNDIKSAIRSIYPNPIKFNFNIDFYTRKNSLIKIELANLSGKINATLFEGKIEKGLNNKEFSNLNFSPGIYILKLFENGVLTDSKRIIFR